MTAPSHESGRKPCLGGGTTREACPTCSSLRVPGPRDHLPRHRRRGAGDTHHHHQRRGHLRAWRPGRCMDTAAAAFPPQKAAIRDASADRMTAVAVPNTSNRGCPSSLAGTTCRRDQSRISASAHRSTIRCRTDRSGPFRRWSDTLFILASRLRLLPTAPLSRTSSDGRRNPGNLLTTCRRSRSQDFL